MDSNKSILVVSAHAADFVWRAGGAIALYAQRGYRVRILCLSYGERGESERLWRQPGMTLECVKTSRRAESEKAAGILGAEIRFFDSGDYPIRPTDETVHEMVVEFRQHQPEFVLTHSLADPYNFDHPDATNLTLRTRVYAQAAGYPAEGKKLGAPPVFIFEPHQPEQCEFKPQVLLDITPVYEIKRQAMESMEAQEHLWEYYSDLARRRGTQAVRNGGRKDIRYAEAFQRIYPQVSSEFS
ncbi:MAG TPA: PIG-L deacetylase family protein [Candidatus Acidoferrales bacterium]|jgi:4-oxalomesaconate hydratase|nr:PIG-L deacetylase family protein [Candidatus Acidoferrales bacterium]